VLLNKKDIEFMWNELVLFLHLFLIAAFLFIGIYAWDFNQKLAFIIFGADIIFILSVMSAVIRRTAMSKIKNPYKTKEFIAETNRFVKTFKRATEADIAKTLQSIMCSAYEKGLSDGKRKG